MVTDRLLRRRRANETSFAVSWDGVLDFFKAFWLKEVMGLIEQMMGMSQERDFGTQLRTGATSYRRNFGGACILGRAGTLHTTLSPSRYILLR